ncbi:unnamed protein product [Caenorhabditis angaria]|uniref:CCHC-type domain-containing protein n=1 Tax=Caenorhabditis angaria TaxID=860376 RepID=A0A9P1IS54_9PELO|nr:unnamed protein product [Caenorhabditis angaria]
MANILQILQNAKPDLEDILVNLNLDKSSTESYKNQFKKHIEERQFEERKKALIDRQQTLYKIHEECTKILTSPPPDRSITQSKSIQSTQITESYSKNTGSTNKKGRKNTEKLSSHTPHKSKLSSKTKTIKESINKTAETQSKTESDDFYSAKSTTTTEYDDSEETQKSDIPYVSTTEPESSKSCHRYKSTKKIEKKNKSTKKVTKHHRKQRKILTHIPKIDLIKFDGNQLEYQKFKNIFNITIGNSKDITYETKLIYLQSLLQGEVSNIIAGVEQSKEGYKEAWAVLENRYNDPKTTWKILHKMLQEIPESTTKVNSLTETLDKIKTITTQLTNNSQTTNNITTHELIITKFPTNIQQEIDKRETRNTEPWSTTTLLKELENIIKEEKATQMRQKPELETAPYEQRKHISNFVARTNVQQTNNGNKTFHCDFCQSKEHSNGMCRATITKEDKLNIIKQLNLCYNCLKQGHRASECVNARKCRECGRNHHTTLCENNRYQQQTPQNQNTFFQGQNQ